MIPRRMSIRIGHISWNEMGMKTKVIDAGDVWYVDMLI